MKTIIISAILLTVSCVAHAGIEPDKSVGECMAYFAVLQKENGMRAALNMADNQRRAIKLSEGALNRFLQYKNDKPMLQSLMISANGACRDIGIRPADY